MNNHKYISRKQLPDILLALRKQKKSIVFTNGCFDLMHYGHAYYLQQAKQWGDVLIVGLNSDSSVRRLKGPHRPLMPQRARIGMLAALGCVDYVVVFSATTPRQLIEQIQPAVLVKGSDWKTSEIAGADYVLSTGGIVKRVRLRAGYSTSQVIKTVIDRYAGKSSDIANN